MQGTRQHFTCTSCAAVGQEHNRFLGQLTRLCGEDLPGQGACLHTQQGSASLYCVLTLVLPWGTNTCLHCLQPECDVLRSICNAGRMFGCMCSIQTVCPQCSNTEDVVPALAGAHPPGIVYKGGGAHSLCNLLPALQHQISNGNCLLKHPTCTPKEDASHWTVQDWRWLAPATSEAFTVV